MKKAIKESLKPFLARGTYSVWGLLVFALSWAIFTIGVMTLAAYYNALKEVGPIEGWIHIGIFLSLYILACKFGLTYPIPPKEKAQKNKGERR